jgi:hypothetical protein
MHTTLGGYYISFVDSAGGSLSFFPNIRVQIIALYIIFYLAKTPESGIFKSELTHLSIYPQR